MVIVTLPSGLVCWERDLHHLSWIAVDLRKKDQKQPSFFGEAVLQFLAIPHERVFLDDRGDEYLRLKPIRLQSRLAEEMPPPWANKRRRKDHATGTKDSKVSKARPGVGLFAESTEPGSPGTLPGDVGEIPTQPQYEAFRMKPPDVLRLLRRINPAYNLTRQLQREPGSPEPMYHMLWRPSLTADWVAQHVRDLYLNDIDALVDFKKTLKRKHPDEKLKMILQHREHLREKRWERERCERSLPPLRDEPPPLPWHQQSCIATAPWTAPWKKPKNERGYWKDEDWRWAKRSSHPTDERPKSTRGFFGYELVVPVSKTSPATYQDGTPISEGNSVP